MLHLSGNEISPKQELNGSPKNQEMKWQSVLIEEQEKSHEMLETSLVSISI